MLQSLPSLDDVSCDVKQISLEGNRILCRHSNTTRHIQVLRVNDIGSGYFERTVFPNQSVLFEARPQARIEIYSSEMATALLSEVISCDRLQVNNGSVLSC